MGLVLWLSTWSIQENVPYALEKHVYSAVVSGGSIDVCWFRWFIVLFKSSVSMSIFCLIGLSIIESPFLLNCVISPFSSGSLYFMNFGAFWFTYGYNCCIFLMEWPFYYKMSLFISNNFLKPILYNHSCLWLLFACYIIFYPFTFNPSVSLNLKFVSHILRLVGILFSYLVWCSLPFDG